jgi:phenylalanyl-tRNA synthetase beta chain
MAKDITALFGTTFIDQAEYYSGPYDKSVAPPHVEIDDEKACTRFMSARAEGIAVTESPTWLKDALASIGQKSINSIVDITNYVQFAINKPMHAYDAALIQDGTLVARYAKKEEILITLDDKELTLNEQTLVIADTEKPLGLAGIKGGKYSGISSTTTSVILESANFNQSLIRKTSQAYGVRTDASKRFENELSDSLVEEGMRMTLSLIKQLNPSAKVSEITDIYPKKETKNVVQVTVEDVNSLLGTGYSEEEVCGVLNALAFSFTKEGETILVTPPEERLDIRIKEDIAEEVLRIKGLSSVPSILPTINRKGVPHKRLYYENKIKNILFAHGFSDIMTYSFGNEGEVMIKKGLAADKEHLRSTLSSGLLSAFALNMQNGPLLKINLIKMYEFGNVFSKEGEKRELAILVDDGKKKSSYGEDIDYILSEIKRELVAPSVDYQVVSSKPCTVVID